MDTFYSLNPNRHKLGTVPYFKECYKLPIRVRHNSVSVYLGMNTLPGHLIRKCGSVDVEEEAVLVTLVGVEEHEPVRAHGALFQRVADS